MYTRVTSENLPAIARALITLDKLLDVLVCFRRPNSQTSMKVEPLSWVDDGCHSITLRRGTGTDGRAQEWYLMLDKRDEACGVSVPQPGTWNTRVTLDEYLKAEGIEALDLAFFHNGDPVTLPL